MTFFRVLLGSRHRVWSGTRRISRRFLPSDRFWTRWPDTWRRWEFIRVAKPERPFFTALHDLLDQESEITLGELVDSAREQSYGLVVLLLALPSLVPGLSLGAAPVGGLGIMAIGIQMLRGVTRPWIPERIRRQPIHKGGMKNALAKLERQLQRFGGTTRERQVLSQRWMGLVVIWTGFLLFIPVPLPFGNQFPAITLILLGTALLEERPFWGWIGVLAALANTVYFAVSFNLITRECLRILRALHRGFA